MSSEPFPVAAGPGRWPCRPAVLPMEEDKGCDGDCTAAPGAGADSAQCLEGGFEQRVAAFGWATGGRVQQVHGALIGGQPAAGGLLDRRGQRRPFALVAQVGQHGVGLVGPLGQQRQRLGVGAQRGGVVLAAGAHVRGPDRPAVGGGDDLDVAAVGGMLARPPQIHPPVRPSPRAVGPGTRTRSVRISVPSTVTCGWPAARAASSAPRNPGAAAARASMPSCRYR